MLALSRFIELAIALGQEVRSHFTSRTLVPDPPKPDRMPTDIWAYTKSGYLNLFISFPMEARLYCAKTHHLIRFMPVK